MNIKLWLKNSKKSKREASKEDLSWIHFALLASLEEKEGCL